MLAAVYGLQVRFQISRDVNICSYVLQALIFILKREFMLVGWMVVYILSYVAYYAGKHPVY